MSAEEPIKVKAISVAQIISEVAAKHGFSVLQILGARRHARRKAAGLPDIHPVQAEHVAIITKIKGETAT